MPVPVNWGLNILLGWAAVLLTRHSDELRDSAWNVTMLIMIAFESVLFTPVAVYLFRFHPDWSLHYLLDPQIYPRLRYWAFGISALVVVSNYVCLIASFLVARFFELRGHTLLRFAPAVLGGGLVLTDLVAAWPKIVRLAEFETYWRGGGELLIAHPAGIIGLGLVLACGMLLYLMKRFYPGASPPEDL
jgi:hypothetical protein